MQKTWDEKEKHRHVLGTCQSLTHLSQLSQFCSNEGYGNRIRLGTWKSMPTVIYDGGGINMTRTLGALGSVFGPRTFDWVWGFISGLPELRKIVKAEEEKDKSV